MPSTPNLTSRSIHTHTQLKLLTHQRHTSHPNNTPPQRRKRWPTPRFTSSRPAATPSTSWSSSSPSRARWQRSVHLTLPSGPAHPPRAARPPAAAAGGTQSVQADQSAVRAKPPKTDRRDHQQGQQRPRGPPRLRRLARHQGPGRQHPRPDPVVSCDNHSSPPSHPKIYTHQCPTDNGLFPHTAGPTWRRCRSMASPRAARRPGRR